jgi:hypothetical protein
VPTLPNLTWSKLFLLGHAYPLRECIPGLATTSGSDGMDSALEYVLSGAHGLLWPCPNVPGA